jgi:hypothetical protein
MGVGGSVLSTENAAKLEVGRLGKFYEHLQRCHDLGMDEEKIKTAMQEKFDRLIEEQKEGAMLQDLTMGMEDVESNAGLSFRVKMKPLYNATPFEIECFSRELRRNYSPEV